MPMGSRATARHIHIVMKLHNIDRGLPMEWKHTPLGHSGEGQLKLPQELIFVILHGELSEQPLQKLKDCHVLATSNFGPPIETDRVPFGH